MNFPCPECGGEVIPTTKSGRKTRYYTMTLSVPDDIAIPTCNNCGEEYSDAQTAKAVDESVAPLYDRRLREMAKAALEKLAKEIKQNRLENLLGLSEGYLSKLRSGAKTPSPELVVNLTLLAKHPGQVDEVESFWAAG